MLRRKLLIWIGFLVACFVAGAVVAVYLLQDAITDIDRINGDAIVLVDGVQAASDAIADLEDARDGMAVPAPESVRAIELRLADALATIGAHSAAKAEGSAQLKAYERVRSLLPQFLNAEVRTDAQRRETHAQMRSAMRELVRAMRGFVAAEQAGFGQYFRWLVLGLTLSALLMVNVAVFVLLRTAQLVLKPVNELVNGSRELAAEHFEHRVTLVQQDEFGELARAYNRLAEQLQANEERKAETLRQLAVTLNHDLNNAMATIEMQLSLLDRQSGSDTKLARYFREIQSTLGRMSKTVASLKHIRRVVLTDYVDGQKMIDLERSVVPPPAPRPGEVA